jgi:alpha-L-rhamnosidase
MRKIVSRIVGHGLWIAVLAVILSYYFASTAKRTESEATLTPIDLQCDHLKNPAGLDNPQPVFSWILNSTGRGHEQAAYEILVASSRQNLAPGKADLWDSGRIGSRQSIGVAYAGKPLASGDFPFWKVRVWDTKGTVSDWSEVAFWSMGLLDATNWQAKWIGLDDGPLTNGPARWLRKEFVLPADVDRATVYFSGLGWSELYINGQRVGDYVLSPPLSLYSARDYYETYEVSRMFKKGTNAIGVVLGNGRFHSPRKNAVSSGFPKLLLQLHVNFTDGTETNIISDESWRLTTNGPITANNEYDGEDYDARKEFPDWSRAGFDDASWQPAQLVAAPGGVLSGIRQNPVRITEERMPVAIKELKPGVYIYDMGQNMVGWCRLKVQGPAGTQVQLSYAETLTPDGGLYTKNLRSAKATDTYTLNGQGEEVWQPRFTLHGFRYVQVTGFPGTPTLDSLTGCVVGDDLPVTGQFECSNPLLNKIYHNIFWGVRSNYRSIPTDCPQRDERQGWLGDRAEESRGETYFFENDALYSKWLVDMADSQRTNGTLSDVSPAYWHDYKDNVTWPSASIMIPEMLRDQFGDNQAIAEHYDSAKKWIVHMEDYVTNGIIAKDNYGDWCMPPEDPTLIHSKDTNRITHAPLLATPFFYHDLLLMQDYALQLGKTNDAADFGARAAEMKEAFNNKYLNRDTGQYDNGTPTSSVLPLAFDMVPDDLHQKAFSYLVGKLTNDWQSHIGTGLVGAKYLMRVLSDNGRPDLAYTIVTQTNYPSWGYMVEHDATTVWELWNGNTADPSMNSGNHVMLIGDLAIWMYEDLGGIKPDPAVPGFEHIIMKPLPVNGLEFVKASHLSPYGWISSEWHKDGNQFEWKIKVPPGTTATIYLPSTHVHGATESGVPLVQAPGVKVLSVTGDRIVADVQSGSYYFICQNDF